MTQHLSIRPAKTLTGAQDVSRYLAACGRWVTPDKATSWQQTTCRACRGSRAWWKASEQ